MKWTGISLLSILLILSIVYISGPVEPIPVFDASLPKVTEDLNLLEREIYNQENKVKNMKPDNQARIVWSNPKEKKKTPYSIVYLHGLTASQAEGDPVHLNIAKKYGCNLYLARLAGHGIDTTEALYQVTATDLLESAKRAVSIGKALGEKVIIIATSTGASLALYIASENPEIACLVLYSPLIDFYDPLSFLLNKPWGLQIARATIGGNNFIRKSDNPELDKYWMNTYRIEAVVSLRNYLDKVMIPEVFAKIKQPIFMGYYYKNENEQDKTVSVSAMLNAFPKFGTPDQLKEKMAFPKAASHVIASHITSQDVDGVFKETCKFLEEKIGLKPVF